MNATWFWMGKMIGAVTLVFSASLAAQTAAPQGPQKLNDPRVKEKTQVKWSKAREVTSEKQLTQEVSAAKPMAEQLAMMSKPVDDFRPGDGHSLYTKSIILWDGEMFTLVPIGSVLNLPTKLRGHVIDKPKGDFTVWPNFLARNKAWLAGKEVALKMARGDAELAALTLKETSRSDQVLISVYRQCPITVLEPAPPEKDAPAKP
jgi:hypothetical protein